MTVHQRIDSVDAVNSKPATPSGLLQRACDCGQHTGGGMCGTCASKGKSVSQDRSGPVDGSLPSVVRDALHSPGRALDPSTRSFMEQRLGHDFSQVRVHTDREPAASAAFLGARAYTVGDDIVFGAGAYAPGTTGGRHLIAHELTHTLQQRATPAVQAKPLISAPRGLDEQQADRVADAVVAGSEPIEDAFTSPRSRIQRACGPAAIGTPVGCNPQPATFVAGQHIARFNFECDDFAPGEQANLTTFAGRIARSGPVTVHGYASTDGSATFNENLSCARALAAQRTLVANGVAAGRITVQRHGPTAGPAADRRSATIEAPIAPAPPTPAPPTPAPPPTPLTVAFSTVNASSSPAGMPNRIPPRVDTIAAVAVLGFTAPLAPIRISVDGAGGANGDLTINGAATADVTSTTVLRLRGTTQTGVGNGGNLSLVAEQGGTRLAISNSFSVSAIPQNFRITFNSLITGPRRGIRVNNHWESDSRVIADLDQAERSEQVQYGAGSGIFAGVVGKNSGYLPADNSPRVDSHSASVALLTGAGSITANQTFILKDDRTGAVDIPVRNSGFQLSRSAVPLPFGGVLFTTSKTGTATTANGFASTAGTGSVARTQLV